MSLEEDARRRAEAMRVQNRFPSYDYSDSDDDGSDALFAAANAIRTPTSIGSFHPNPSWYNNPSQQTQARDSKTYITREHDNTEPLKMAATLSTTPNSSPALSTPSPDQSNRLYYHDKYYNNATPTPPSMSSPHNIAEQARRDWQNHGTGVTQALEDVRLYNHRRELPNVRVFASAAKVDAAGQDYTAYLIRVEHSDSSKEASITEHRYSEFYKLQQQLEASQVKIPVEFPSRMTLSGRLGNWTPAQILAPEHHQSLIHYRLKQLDTWMVHVVQLMPQLPPQLQEEVHQFLDSKTILPCQQTLRMHQKATTTMAAASESLSWNNPVTFTMGSALRQACRSVETLCHLPHEGHLNQSQLGTLPEADHTIPLDLLRMARGILFVTVMKAGWVVSGRIGTGLLIQRLNASSAETSEPAEWSAPAAIGTFGVGWGALAGADVTHYMVIFTSDSAVRDLVQQSTTLQVGAELSAAMGPLGRSANSHLQTGDWTLHTAYAYAHSQGLFVGVSLEGSVWQVRQDVNAKFYGHRNIEATHLLHQPGPQAAQPLYDRLNLALSRQRQLAASSTWLPSPPPRPSATSSV